MDLSFPGSWLPLSLLAIAVFAVPNGTGMPRLAPRDNIYRQGTDTPSTTEEAADADDMMNAFEEMAMNEDAKLNSLTTKDIASHESNKTILESKLFISLLNGIGLPGKDPFSDPDAFVRFWAHDQSGQTVVKDSTTVWDTAYPSWNEVLEFGSRKWFSLWAQILDRDVFSDNDPLSSKQRFYFKGHCDKKIVAFNNGTATFLYYLQPQPYQ